MIQAIIIQNSTIQACLSSQVSGSPHPQYEKDPSQASFPLTACKSFSIFLQSKSGSPNRLPNTPTCGKQASTILREYLIYLIKICICVHTMFPLLNYPKYSLKSEQSLLSLCIFAQKNGVITIEKNMITDIESATFEI